MRKKTRSILVILLPIQYIAILILRRFPQFIEDYYSQGLYPFLSKISRYVFGWIPFSIGDIFYALLIILLIRWFYKNIKRVRTEPILFVVDILASASVIYFVFHLLWGSIIIACPCTKHWD